MSVGDGLVLPRSVVPPPRSDMRHAVLHDPKAHALYTVGRIEEAQRNERSIEKLRSAIRRSLAKYGECEGRRILEIALEDSL